ncbi:MAG: hypothetical protein C4560_08640 [Nitrospiraceae bacterium]|nr:MAG: hypothetical protein C4560_08640 [Nitrospiraceae bacterium]
MVNYEFKLLKGGNCMGVDSILGKMYFLQNMVIDVLSSVHPSIEHNITKIQALKKAFFHCSLEKLEGDYMEYGVFEGTSFISAFMNDYRINKSRTNRKYIGFDSFEGFKFSEDIDKHPFFREGDFKSSYDFVQKRVSKKLKDRAEFRLIKGYLEDTLKDKTPMDFGVEKIAVSLIDCDLHVPARMALNFMKGSLQEGSIIILDDYFAYKGSMEKGVAGAFELFKDANRHIEFRRMFDYGYGGAGFIVSKIHK